MKLNRVYKDTAFDTPLIDPIVYYTDDMQYKVIISFPLKYLGSEIKLLTIGKCHYSAQPPDDYICREILKALNFNNAVLAPDFPGLRKDIIRYMVYE